jgi:hypothetical protein
MKVLAWHVHGSWMTSFVHGPWNTFVPLVKDRGPDGRGRAQTYAWPERAIEVPNDELQYEAFDLVVLQRPHEASLLLRWTGLRAGIDVPAIYVEHDCPRGNVPWTAHPMADQSHIPIVHVTDFNRLMWDNGDARSVVIEHGVVDPGYRYRGTRAVTAVVTNEPVRRSRLVGGDLIPLFAESGPIDVFGIDTEALPPHPGMTAYGDVPHAFLLDCLAERRTYAHLTRWTSLGMSLLEAMHLGMPVLALETTAAADAVPSGAGIVSADPRELVLGAAELRKDADLAREMGERARAAALDRFGLDRFLADWYELLMEVAS